MLTPRHLKYGHPHRTLQTMSSEMKDQLQASDRCHDTNFTWVTHRCGGMTPSDAVIVAGHWISALICVSTLSTGAVQLLPEQ